MKHTLIFLAFMASTLTAGELVLTWRDNSTNEKGFVIERSFDDQNWVPIWQVDADIETFIDDGLEPSTQYFYRVAAFNDAGQSGYTNSASAITKSDVAVDGDPSTLTVTDNTGQLLNLSTRAVIDVELVIGGFVITGDPIPILIRAVGPTLAEDPFLLDGMIEDVQMTLVDADGATITTNDNWTGQGPIDAAIGVGAFPLIAGSKDSVILTTLPAGAYTVLVEGVGGSTGRVLLELYHVQ